MKRNIIAAFLALALCFCLAVTASASETLLFDEANLLTSAEEALLNQQLQTISRTYDAQILIVTQDSVQGGIDYYVEYLYDSAGFGYGENHDGVLLLVCMDVREYRILSNGFAADAITAGDIDAISDSIVSDLSEGSYAEAFTEFAEQCDYYLNGYRNGFPFDFGGNLGLALVIGLVAGLVVAFVLKGQLKTVRKQHGAGVYVKPGSMRITASRDIYLYRTVTRTKKESGSSSGSRSGSSRNVGGGRF